MEHRKHKLALFLVAQALGVAAMIFVLRAGRGADCQAERCASGSAISVAATLFVIVAELGILSATLRVDGPVWKSLLGLGILALIAAAFVAGGSLAMPEPRRIAPVAVGWHVASGLLLVATGTAGGVWELLARLRRPDQPMREDQASSAMWPLD